MLYISTMVFDTYDDGDQMHFTVLIYWRSKDISRECRSFSGIWICDIIIYKIYIFLMELLVLLLRLRNLELTGNWRLNYTRQCSAANVNIPWHWKIEKHLLQEKKKKVKTLCVKSLNSLTAVRSVSTRKFWSTYNTHIYMFTSYEPSRVHILNRRSTA